MTREQRTEFRRALQDELATVRAINSGLRTESLEAERARLIKARAECLHIIRAYLARLHPGSKSAGKIAHKRPRARR